MENGKYRWVNNLSLILLIICFWGCSSSEEKKDTDTISKEEKLLLENGDIIYRHGNGIFSGYFVSTSQKEQLYSHAGIISIKGDSIYVIHSEASEFTGIGGIRKETLQTFLKDISTWGVYRLDTTIIVRDSVALVASNYLNKNISFDFDFNSLNDDKIYCTELIALSINKAASRQLIEAKGKLGSKTYFAVDDTYMIPQMKKIISHHSENKQSD